MKNNSENGAPLITFCLFTYNQEVFVRDAVLGALAQTYSPLEIIVSDDCSTDRTFDILREVLAGYQGPHGVKLLRNERNMGLVGHVNKMFSLAEGELVVLAAGDDISFPERTVSLVSAWLEDRTVDAVCSAYIKMTEEGKEIGVGSFKTFNPAEQWLATKRTFWFGCSAAYTKRLFTTFGPIAYNTTEDVVYYRRALLLGGIRYIAQPLVKYRIGCGISTQKLDQRLKVLQRNAWRTSLGVQMLSDLTKVPQTPFLIGVGAWWCRNLEVHLLFRKLLEEKGWGRLVTYLSFFRRSPGKALLKMGWLFRF